MTTNTSSSNAQSLLSKSFTLRNRASKAYLENFDVSNKDLAELGRNGGSYPRPALIQLFRTFLNNFEGSTTSSARINVIQDEEMADDVQKTQACINDIMSCLQEDENMMQTRMNVDDVSGNNDSLPMGLEKRKLMEQHMELAAAILAIIVLKSDPDLGISNENEEILHRMREFGSNTFTKKKMKSYLVLCWEALHNFVLIMLLIMATVTITVETTIGLDKGEKCNGCWLESVGIFLSVFIVVNISAGIDYMKQFAFKRLSKSLDETNKKIVIRNGEHVVITDTGIVVGDILLVNSHSLATIPADCILLGNSNDIRMDESSLTGESNAVRKKPGDVILSGTNAVEGSGTMVVIAVGVHSVAGRIKAHVYECEESDHVVGDTKTPLYTKIDKLAKQIAIFGTGAAVSAFILSTALGLGYRKVEEGWTAMIDYFVVAVTVLAVAVPEGLPLAVVLALAFSSNKMMDEHNMVKSLDACETMGSATTICTDKTGTLTANRMTVCAIFASQKNYICMDPKLSLSQYLLEHNDPISVTDLSVIAKSIAICTMNETSLIISDGKVERSSGNPTEVALLTFLHDLGYDYHSIRSSTPGRMGKCDFNFNHPEGKLFNFTSSRKMMSWAIPLLNGGYRLYSKGAGEVILTRSVYELVDGVEIPLNEMSTKVLATAIEQYARRGMRCLGIAYRDLPSDINFECKTSYISNSDGTDAFVVETDLVLCALVGIEDPVRPEVPDAINRCYQAGIDVRLVTGDNPNTAMNIAFQVGILKDYHFVERSADIIASNLRPFVLMEGKDFRTAVHKTLDDGTCIFDQEAFDTVWPHLRVLARSSPDDKLILAHGLNQSLLFKDEKMCHDLMEKYNIKIFPDRQVVAMTGDGTNDAPALKRADIGFAMGISGTQIAKDAADIILLDDNFASIVTAVKWGRNVYTSIQKFLQFQLTVNISAVVTALVGAIVYQKSPLAAIQLLWVNLLMDSLASLALASEPPSNELLTRPPVNRSKSMITKRMMANIFGHAIFQVLVTLLLLFQGPIWLNLTPGHLVEYEEGQNSVHYTLIFNTFVWMQLFNEINCRNLNGELNVFRGLCNNQIFLAVLFSTSILQCIIIEFGGRAPHVAEGGLSGKLWALSIGVGALSIPIQQLINFCLILLQFTLKFELL